MMPPQHPALRESDDGGVERLIHVHVLGERVDRQTLEGIDLPAWLPQRLQLDVVDQALGRQPRRRPFEHAAEFNGIQHLARC